MNCHYHPDRSVERECRVCHELICTDCVVKVGDDAVCKNCLSETISLKDLGVATEVPAPQPLASDKKAVNVLKSKTEALNATQKSGFLTVMFSLLPGLGHFYLGLQQRGLSLMILFFGVIFLNTIVPNGLQFTVALVIPILWFYSQFDALKYRTQINLGETVEDRAIFPQLQNAIRLSWLGWGLAALGVINIFYDLMYVLNLDYRIQGLIEDSVTALILIGLGWWLLKGKADRFFDSRRKRDDQNHA
jgi:hypothetical protein